MSKLDELLARQYPFRVVVEPSGGWSLVFPDLPGCLSYAEIWEDIGPQARTAFALWMESEHEQGHEIPVPTVGDATPAFPAEAFDVPGSPELLTAQDVAAELGITTRRVNALASRRGVGRRVGRGRIYLRADLASLRPRARGRPAKQQSLDSTRD